MAFREPLRSACGCARSPFTAPQAVRAPAAEWNSAAGGAKLDGRYFDAGFGGCFWAGPQKFDIFCAARPAPSARAGALCLVPLLREPAASESQRTGRALFPFARFGAALRLLAALGALRSPRVFFLSFPRKRESRRSGLHYFVIHTMRQTHGRFSPSIFTLAEQCHSDGAAQPRLPVPHRRSGRNLFAD